MAQRNPLQILIVGTANEENKKALIEAIKRSGSDDSLPMTFISPNTHDSRNILSDNTQDFDAVYITYDSLETFMAVDGFVSEAKSIRRKNGLFVLADITNEKSGVDDETVRNKQSKLEMEFFFSGEEDDFHSKILDLCRKKKQQNSEIIELADLIKQLLENAATQLEEEINSMRVSSCYRWTPSSDVAIDILLASAKTAAQTFSLTMSNEDANKFSNACSAFLNKSYSINYYNKEQKNDALKLLIPAILVLMVVAIMASVGAAGLIFAGVVALLTLAAIVVSLLKIAGNHAESDIIKTSENVSDIINRNKLDKFHNDASGMLLFKPKREEHKKIEVRNAVGITPELQSLLANT